MEGISAGGLVSGLDTNAIIDGLTSLEMNKVRRIDKEKKEEEDKKEAFNDLVTRLGTFSSKAESLTKESTFNQYTSSSNEEDVVVVRGGDDSTPGEYEVRVDRLASSQKVASKSFGAINTALGFSGTFEISTENKIRDEDPTKQNVEIKVNATDALIDIVKKINAAENVGVSASILSLSSGENRMVLTAKDEGTEHFYMKELTGNALGASGLGIKDDTQKIRTEFSLLKEVGQNSIGSTLMGELSTGIGSNNLTNGDAIEISGTRADGTAVAATDFVFDPATDTVDDLLSSIASAFGNTVSATLGDSGEIILQDTTGGLNEMSLNLSFKDNDSSGSTLILGESEQVNNFTTVVSEGKDAFFTVDGIAVNSSSNEADDVVRGTTFVLKEADPTKTVKLSLDLDNDAIKGKIKEFVEEYNALVKFIDQKSKITFEEDSSSQDFSDQTSRAEKTMSKGEFAGDGTVRRIKADLAQLMTGPIQVLAEKTQYTSLSRIGIVTGSGNDGTLDIDDEDLDKALETDLDGVRRLFANTGWSDNPEMEMGRFTDDTKTGKYFIDTDADTIDSASGDEIDAQTAKRLGLTLTSQNGDSNGLSIKVGAGVGTGNFTFARGLAGQIKQYYDVSNDFVDGMFKTTRESYDRKVEEYTIRADELAERADRFRTSLVKRFAGMEQTMARLQSQSSAFMAQVGAA